MTLARPLSTFLLVYILLSPAAISQTKAEIDKVTAITKREQTNYSALTFLADLAQANGDYKKAESCYKKILDIYKDDPGIGSKSARCALTMSQIGLCDIKLDKKPEATKLSKEALALIDGQTPDNNPAEANYILIARRNCAHILGKDMPPLGPPKPPPLQLKSIPRSEIANLPAREKQIKGFLLKAEKKGKSSPAYIKDLLYLANLYTLEKRTVEAEPMFKKAISLYEHKLGKNSPELIIPLSNYGYLLMQAGKAQDAEVILNRMQQIRTIAESGRRKSHIGAKL